MKKNKIYPENKLKPAQIRAIKSLIAAVDQMQSHDNEAELFESASDAFRLLAFLIIEAGGYKPLEYGLDNLNEMILKTKILHLDN